MSTSDRRSKTALAFLDHLESNEARLLSWGLTDSFFSEDELLSLAEEFLEASEVAGTEPPFWAGDDMIEWLTDASLLWELPLLVGDEVRYRSRVAEGVRLMSRLRQVFSADLWRTSPSLVADYRFHLRPRLFPRRDIGLGEISAALGLPDPQLPVLEDLLRAQDGKTLELSRFQIDATREVLSSLEDGGIGATLVSAGTASGKSLAFFLPALLYLSTKPAASDHAHVLAIYPRNELLKDQLRATLSYAAKVEEAFVTSRGRGLSVAPFFGALPHTAQSLLGERHKDTWRRQGPGFICPFLKCPQCGTGEMMWMEADVREGTERLSCLRGDCSGALGPERIRLTRQSMVADPPDILFTTTEMLNRQLSSHQYRRLFGVGVSGSPGLVLLDEVHTYGGVTGAQVGLLLRRWRYLARAWPHFVGLSATLAEARRFMADLTGVYANKVRVIEPAPQDMDHEGMEYTLILRGDPVSGTALLSTTIQASMLLSRLMDQPEHPATPGDIYGTRVFAFTDNLDVTNRLYDGLRDAEGYWANGPNNKPGGSLANLRDSSLPPMHDRWKDGQSWKLVEDIGHNLSPGVRTRIGRTSSQDSGVDPSVSLVVATASLEVGFDDPDCGAVIQHKAPPDPAGFIQRRGRAGRGRAMRPWTVVVLSDYGRDRLAYQGYERLIDPVVPPRTLPLENRYVLKIQAGYALIDWLVDRLSWSVGAEGWKDLSGQQDNRARWSLYVTPLLGLLEDSGIRQTFSEHLEKSLGINEDTAAALLWEAPRSILLEVVPTLLRRLEHGWATSDGGSEAPPAGTSSHPLPEFVTPNLFSDLNLSEVLIVVPGDDTGVERRLGLTHALSEFAPGKVSKRFAVTRGNVSHWIPIPEVGTSIDLATFTDPGDVVGLGRFRVSDEGTARAIDVVRPRQIRVQETPREVADTSNSFLKWQHEILPTAEGHSVAVPPKSAWRNLITELRFFTHAMGSAVEVRRMADRTSAQTRYRHGEVGRVLKFEREVDGSMTPVALGFITEADAVRVGVSLPAQLHTIFQQKEELLRGLRTGYFRHRISADERLEGLANSFERDWLADIYLSCLTFNALSQKVSLMSAAAAINDGTAKLGLIEVLPLVFRAPEFRPEGEDQEGADLERRRLYGRLEALVHNQTCLALLDETAAVLWDPPDGSWDEWLQRRTIETVGAAFLGACYRVCDGLAPGDVLVDFDTADPDGLSDGDSSTLHHLWLTETTPGGAGFVEDVLESMTENRQRFLALVDAELAPSDFELADVTLRRLVSWLGGSEADGSEEVRRCVESFRRSQEHGEMAAAFHRLRAELKSKGLPVNQPALASVNLRVLRTGSSTHTDRLLASLVEAWIEAESALGVEIEGRVFACVMSERSDFDDALSTQWDLPSHGERRAWRFDAFLSLMWPRGATLRGETLRHYHPYRRPPQGDRLLVEVLKAGAVRTVDVTADGWRTQLTQTLLQDGQAALRGRLEDRANLKQAVLTLLAEPLDTTTLLLYAEVRGVTADGDQVSINLELPEYFS